MGGWMTLEVAALITAPWNYKQTEGIEEKKMKLREALKARGQIVNLIVRELPDSRYEVVNGNHRLEVFHELSVKEAMCFNLGVVPDAIARIVALETNELEIPADPLKLGGVVRSIAEAVPVDEILRTLPYSPAQLDAMLLAANFTWDGFRSNSPTADELEAGQGPKKHRALLVLDLPRDLVDRFKAEVKRFDTDAEAIEHCVTHLASFHNDTSQQA